LNKRRFKYVSSGEVLKHDCYEVNKEIKGVFPKERKKIINCTINVENIDLNADKIIFENCTFNESPLNINTKNTVISGCSIFNSGTGVSISDENLS